MTYELDYSGLIQIHLNQTKTSRKQKETNIWQLVQQIGCVFLSFLFFSGLD